MPKATDADIAVQFQDGSQIRTFDRLVWRDRFDDPLGSLRFVVKPKIAEILDVLPKLQRGNIVSIKINGRAVHVPIITRRRFTSRNEGPRIEVEAKSVLSTPYQGSAALDLSLSADAETPISTFILEALAPYGFDTVIADSTGHVSVITGGSLSGRAPTRNLDELKEKDWQVQPGEAAYRYCQRLCSRHGLVLRVNHEGTILIVSPDYDQTAAYSLHQSRDQQPGSNRLVNGYEVVETNDGQFSHCVVSGASHHDRTRSQSTAPFGAVAWDNYAPPTTGFGEEVTFEPLPAALHAYRSQGAAYKPLFRRDKKAADADRCSNWAARLIGYRAASAWQLKAEVDGWVSAEGLVWSVDTIASVYLEDFGGLRADLWIHEVERSLDSEGGQKTRLTLIPKGALVLTTDP